MRNLPKDLDPAVELDVWQQKCKEYQDDTLLRYSCETITPLYGGGVKAGEVDQELPIRPSGLRGQLRFWWRLLNYNSDSEALFQAERAIWGGIGKEKPVASKVALRLRGVPKLEWRDLKLADRYNAYALFPARDAEHSVAPLGIEFTMELTLDKALTEAQRQQVKEAVRWWASFGGVGARTRRGLGAVKVAGLLPVKAEEVAAKGGVLGLRRGEERDASRAWNLAVDCLKAFRQGEDIGRNPGDPGSKFPGRSRWPEADAIRRLQRTHASNHKPRHPVTDYYPRAAFGLPIVYKFKDDKRNDPQKSTLEPIGKDVKRMASPLILRPYWNGKAYQAAALLLPRWEEALKVELAFQRSKEKLATWPLDKSEQKNQADLIKPMQGRGNDPLTAFLVFFQRGCK